MLRPRRRESVGGDDDVAFPARHHVIIVERFAVDLPARATLIFGDELLAFEEVAGAEGAVAVEASEYLHQHPAEVFMIIADAGELPIEERRTEEHTSELQSLIRMSYHVFCLK